MVIYYFIYLGHYEKAFMSLIRGSDSAKKAMFTVVHRLNDKEMNSVTRKRGPNAEKMLSMKGELTTESLENFSWAGVVDEARDKIPTLTAILEKSLPAPTHIRDDIVVGAKKKTRYTCAISNMYMLV